MLFKFWMLLFIPALLIHFYYRKEIASQLAFLCMGISTVGFFIFADCCSYAARNGIWIFMFITCAAMLGARIWENKIFIHEEKSQSTITSKRYSFRLISFSITVALITNFLISNKEMRTIQIEKQWQVGNASLNALIFENKHHLGSQGVVISKYIFVPWLPGLKNKYVKCRTHECVEATIKKHPGSLVLTKKIKNNFDYPEFHKNASIKNLLGKASNYELFKTQ